MWPAGMNSANPRQKPDKEPGRSQGPPPRDFAVGFLRPGCRQGQAVETVRQKCTVPYDMQPSLLSYSQRVRGTSIELCCCGTSLGDLGLLARECDHPAANEWRADISPSGVPSGADMLCWAVQREPDLQRQRDPFQVSRRQFIGRCFSGFSKRRWSALRRNSMYGHEY
jgi:hypothetical protein